MSSSSNARMIHPGRRLTAGVFAAGLAALIASAVNCSAPSRPDMPPVVSDVFPAAESLRQLAEPSNGPDRISIWQIISGGERVGYMAQRPCRTKSGTFTLQIIFDDAGTIRALKVTDYNAQRGMAVTSREFGGQFVGMDHRSSVRLGDDVDAVSGATISSRSATDAARQIIAAVHSLIESSP